ncbi:MAG TPA: 4Fe-4S binding protein [Anaeromyxobacter sp.]
MLDDAPRSTPAPAPAAPLATPAPAGSWTNPWRRLPSVRAAVQAGYLLFVVAVGWQFARFFSSAHLDGPVTGARPPAVEGFLPIAALVGLRRWLSTGFWDEVHPAGLTILLAAIVTSLLAKKGFCSWVCPVGAISRALEWVGRRTLWRRGFPRVPRRLDLALSSVKYLLLVFFAFEVFLSMPVEALDAFVGSPYNLVADAKMLLLFAHPTTTLLAVLGGLVALSLVVKHAWCRWLCPYGALLGVASLASPQHVRRDPAACNDCRACTRACPVEIPVHARLRVLSSECTGCLSCVAACTVPDCLGVTRKGARSLSPWLVPAAVLGVMLGFWAVARLAGFWETTIPPEAFRMAYQALGL